MIKVLKRRKKAVKNVVTMKIATLGEREKLVGLKDYIKDNILIFDGAMGTMLQKKGLKLGENPELLNITQPSIIQEIHKEYIASGANTIANLESEFKTLACLAICAASCACGSPAAENTGNFCPLTKVLSPSIADIPV